MSLSSLKLYMRQLAWEVLREEGLPLGLVSIFDNLMGIFLTHRTHYNATTDLNSVKTLPSP